LETWDDGARRLLTLKTSRRRLGGQLWPPRTPRSSRCRLQVYRRVCVFVCAHACEVARYLLGSLLQTTLLTCKLSSVKVTCNLVGIDLSSSSVNKLSVCWGCRLLEIHLRVFVGSDPMATTTLPLNYPDPVYRYVVNLWLCARDWDEITRAHKINTGYLPFLFRL